MSLGIMGSRGKEKFVGGECDNFFFDNVIIGNLFGGGFFVGATRSHAISHPYSK